MKEGDLVTILIGDRLATGVVTKIEDDGTFRLNGLRCYADDVLLVMRVMLLPPEGKPELVVVDTRLRRSIAARIAREFADKAAEMITEQMRRECAN